jgi:hypothetical protein
MFAELRGAVPLREGFTLEFVSSTGASSIFRIDPKIRAEGAQESEGNLEVRRWTGMSRNQGGRKMLGESGERDFALVIRAGRACVRMRHPIGLVLVTVLLFSVTAANAEAPELSQVVAISSADNNWEITVPVGHATLVVPHGGFQVVKAAFGGSASRPRYFFLKDEAKGEKIVSGWLEPARKIADVRQTLQTSWRKESAHLKTVGMEPSAVEVGETDDWATIAYQIANKHGSSVHIRASRIVADTWIDLHLSVTSEATAADNRVLVAQMLKSMTIRVK